MWIAGAPAGLILAVPIAVLGGVGKGAEHGILIKSAEHLENLGKVDTIVFDKTGTLTEGKFTLRHIQSFGNSSDDDVLSLAATVDFRSDHPLARAIVDAANAKGMVIKEPREFKYEKGMGVEARTDRGVILSGTTNFLSAKGVKISQEIIDTSNKTVKEDFYTPVFVALNKSIVGVIYLGDQIRSGAKSLVKELKNLGISDLWILSGDKNENVQFVAQNLGIENYAAQLLPDQKVENIKTLSESGKIVMMIGDGINDSPSLAAAAVGVAMGGRGNDLSIESSDIVLLSEKLKEIPQLIRLGRKTVSIIKQDIFAASFFHLVMIVLAALGLIGFIGGAVIHEISATFIILNTGRLMFTSVRPQNI